MLAEEIFCEVDRFSYQGSRALKNQVNHSYASFTIVGLNYAAMRQNYQQFTETERKRERVVNQAQVCRL